MGKQEAPEKRQRYRTRMFDSALSFPTTSDQVKQIGVESEAEQRSVASLLREAVDQFIPRIRDRRRKRERKGQAANRHD